MDIERARAVVKDLKEKIDNQVAQQHRQQQVTVDQLVGFRDQVAELEQALAEEEPAA